MLYIRTTKDSKLGPFGALLHTYRDDEYGVAYAKLMEYRRKGFAVILQDH